MEDEVKEAVPKYNFISPEDYLAMEMASQEKHEYFKGEVFAMSGASWEHNVIAKNINTTVLPFLKGKPCDMFGSDLRIHIPENAFYTYPDFSIICGKPDTTGAEKNSALTPTVIIEILSKSTKDYDRGTKFMLYRSIISLQEYITIDSLSVSVEIYTRQQDNSWNMKEFKQISDSFYISTIGLPLLLQDVYENVSFEE